MKKQMMHLVLPLTCSF